jgi:hypothetical protein
MTRTAAGRLMTILTSAMMDSLERGMLFDRVIGLNSTDCERCFNFSRLIDGSYSTDGSSSIDEICGDVNAGQSAPYVAKQSTRDLRDGRLIHMERKVCQNYQRGHSLHSRAAVPPLMH